MTTTKFSKSLSVCLFAHISEINRWTLIGFSAADRSWLGAELTCTAPPGDGAIAARSAGAAQPLRQGECDRKVEDVPTRRELQRDVYVHAQVLYYSWRVCSLLFSHLVMISLVVAYCILGAVTFERLEADYERQIQFAGTLGARLAPRAPVSFATLRKALNIVVQNNTRNSEGCEENVVKLVTKTQQWRKIDTRKRRKKRSRSIEPALQHLQTIRSGKVSASVVADARWPARCRVGGLTGMLNNDIVLTSPGLIGETKHLADQEEHDHQHLGDDTARAAVRSSELDRRRARHATGFRERYPAGDESTRLGRQREHVAPAVDLHGRALLLHHRHHDYR
ncbi:hypothetical protein EVAR_96580_1 [Eumeta japonica]|uniref:Uncharacterized protein n=1 Tax=Eumeta variegata TaxID=151549 RepID=A0A4C1WTI7_EUMVA|nr:hypothetical protein EVAR_96580_1 [Eumeta japonica]